MLTDSHCHLTKKYFDNITEVIEKAKTNKVTKFINIGCNHESNQQIVKLITDIPEMYGILGIHPNDIYDSDPESLTYLSENIQNKKILAIGEIGLDYHYDSGNKKNQREWFEKQLTLAEKHKIPVVIHSREAAKDTIEILKKYRVTGIVHSFGENYETALEYIKLGFILGINGVITFKNSNLKDVILRIPLEYIVLETDCPYLTPEPYRGQKNEPKHILEIAKYIANLKDITIEEVAEKTNANLSRIFDI